VVPVVEEADQPAAASDENSFAFLDAAVELDQPELVVEPVHELGVGTGMDAVQTDDEGPFDLDPRSFPSAFRQRPVEAAEEADGAAAQELVRDPPSGFQSRKTAIRLSRASGESDSSLTSPLAWSVSRICPRNPRHAGQIATCRSKRTRVSGVNAP